MGEQSTIEQSGIEESAMSGVSTTEAPGGQDKKQTAPLLLCLLCAALVVIGVVFALLGTDETIKDTSPGGEPPGNGEPVGNPPARQPPTSTPQPSAGNMSGAGGSGGPANVSTATTTAGTTTTTIPPPMHRLLCVVDEYSDVKKAFPPDGLCDFMFYAEVTLVGEDFRPYNDPTSFELFLEVSREYNRTAFGLSFPQEMGVFLSGKEADLAKAAGKHAHINGYGMLNVLHQAYAWPTLHDGHLQLLKVFQRQLANANKGVHPSQVVLGGQVPDFGVRNPHYLVERMYDSAPKLGVTMLVFKSHFAWFRIPLKPVGPNHLNYSAYVVRSLRDMATEIAGWDPPPNPRILVLLSVSMGCMAYLMPPSWKESDGAKEFDAPLHATMIEHAETCKNNSGFQAERTDNIDHTEFTRGNGQTKALMVYDTGDSLAAKVRTAYDIIKPKVRNYGFAAYYIGLDDFAGICGQGKFSRLAKLKTAVTTAR